MLDIRLELSKINYRKCIEVLLPPLVEHCASKSAPNELDTFLAKLGPDAARAACAVLDGMSVDDRDKMVVWLVSAHEERMRNSANRHLSELFGAPLVRIGHFAALDRPGNRLSLLATQIDADYASLLHSPLVKEGVAQLGQENAILKGAAQLALQFGVFQRLAARVQGRFNGLFRLVDGGAARFLFFRRKLRHAAHQGGDAAGFAQKLRLGIFQFGRGGGGAECAFGAVHQRIQISGNGGHDKSLEK